MNYDDYLKSGYENSDFDADGDYLIGVRTIEIFIPEAQSLKEKRFVVRSIKDRLRNKFNISVAEIGHLNLWQRSVIAVALISNDRKRIEKILSSIDKLFDRDSRFVIINSKIEIF